MSICIECGKEKYLHIESNLCEECYKGMFKEEGVEGEDFFLKADVAYVKVKDNSSFHVNKKNYYYPITFVIPNGEKYIHVDMEGNIYCKGIKTRDYESIGKTFVEWADLFYKQNREE